MFERDECVEPDSESGNSRAWAHPKMTCENGIKTKRKTVNKWIKANLWSAVAVAPVKQRDSNFFFVVPIWFIRTAWNDSAHWRTVFFFLSSVECETIRAYRAIITIKNWKYKRTDDWAFVCSRCISISMALHCAIDQNAFFFRTKSKAKKCIRFDFHVNGAQINFYAFKWI